MVVKDGAKLVIDPTAPVAREVLDYLKSEHSYGNKDSRMGKALEKRFGGTPYGWERDMLRLILATLFRAGEIEVTSQGNRFHNYQDPASRTPFTSNPAFRASLFSPRQSIGLKTLTQAVQRLEDLTGEEVDVEEGAIATAFKKVAADELEKLLPLKATVEAHRLPVLDLLSEYQQTLAGIQSSASDDCVRILTENGADFAVTRDQVRKLREALNAEAIGVLRQARQATDQVWQRLAAHHPSPELSATVEELNGLLSSEQFIASWSTLVDHTRTVLHAYQTAYRDLFDRRRQSYESAIEEIRNRPEWEPLAATHPSMAAALLSPLLGRVGADEDRDAVLEGKSLGKASLTEMESDLVALAGLKASVLVKLQELSIGSEKKAPVRKVRVSEFVSRPIQTQEDLTRALKLIEEALQKCIDEGAVVILE